MAIAKCPHCEGEVEVDHIEDPIIKLAVTLGLLLVSASMMRVALASEVHSSALPGFEERIEELSSIAIKDGEELTGWGEFYDPDEAAD